MNYDACRIQNEQNPRRSRANNTYARTTTNYSKLQELIFNITIQPR